LTLVEKIIKSKLILVCYDFDDTEEGNKERAIMQKALTKDPFHAKMLYQSVYYLPVSMASVDSVRKWAKPVNGEFFVFGNVDTDLHGKTKLAKEYVKLLRKLVTKMKDKATIVKNDFQDFEKNFDHSNQNLRGWASKISGARERFELVKNAVDRVGDDDDELDLEMMSDYINRLEKRFEKMKELRPR